MDFLRLADAQGKDGRLGHSFVGKSVWQIFEAVILILVVAGRQYWQVYQIMKIYLLISGRPAQSHAHGFFETS